MASEPSTQSRVMFQAADEAEEPSTQSRVMFQAADKAEEPSAQSRVMFQAADKAEEPSTQSRVMFQAADKSEEPSTQSRVMFQAADKAEEPSTQSRVMFQAADKAEEPAHRKLGKLTVKYNRKDLQRRLDVEEWIDGQLHLLFDCEEEEIPELEIDIDELLELTDEGQRTRLQELLQECGKPKEDFINGLLYRIKGLRKMSGPLKK